MKRELIIQRLRQLASNKLFDKQVSETLDCAADIIEQETKETKTTTMSIEGGGYVYWHVCDECRTVVNPWDKSCPNCKRMFVKEG